MSAAPVYIHVFALAIDPAWRGRSTDDRAADLRDLAG